jgi:hypothetical protein
VAFSFRPATVERITPKRLDDHARQIEEHKSERRSSHIAELAREVEARADLKA